MQSKKGAIELSMTTIIVIVLGVTLLILGLVFVRNIFGRLGEISEQSFLIAEKDLQERIGASQRMYIPGENFEVESGGAVVMTAVVQNFATNDEKTRSKFRLESKPGNDASKILKFEQPPELNLDVGDVKGFTLKITTPKGAEPGKTYSVVVYVYKENEEYESDAFLVSIKE